VEAVYGAREIYAGDANYSIEQGSELVSRRHEYGVANARTL